MAADKVIRVTELQGQGKWVIETVYEDRHGTRYTVWSDLQGEQWYLDIFKDLAD
jgi:hypothetical protein